MEVIKIFSAFAGYDAMLLALKRLVQNHPDFSFECVGYSEIDKYACIAHDALHPAIKSYGDITAVDWSTVPDFDILTWSSPCQSVSAAGKLKGMTDGTDATSAVIWSIDRCLAVKHPKYILLENVANIVGARFIGEFNRFQDLLRSFGYKCHTKIMNAKQYGVPQNRERLFLVATSEEVDGYHFPEPFALEKRLKDVLEQDVDERYYLSADRVAGMLKSTLKERGKGNGFAFSPKTEESETANCITTREGGRKTDNFIAEDAVEVVGNLYDGNPQSGRVYDPEGIAPTLDTCNGGNREPKGGHKQMGVLEYDGRIVFIRRLTERELFRIMDVDEPDIDILLSAGISKTQLAKLAGNSIVVNCLYHIFRKMFIDVENESQQTLLF